MRILFCAYQWSGKRELSGYFAHLVSALERAGAEVRVLLGNELLRGLDHTYSLDPALRASGVVAEIRTFDPTFTISINNAGMFGALESALRGPVLKWMVDDPPHFFLHDGLPALGGVAGPNTILGAYSTSLVGVLERLYPAQRGKVQFWPHVTGPGLSAPVAAQDIPISFIGSHLDKGRYASLLARGLKHPETARRLMRLERAMTEDYLSALEPGRLGADFEAGLEADARLLDVAVPQIRLFLSDVITTRNRMRSLASLADLGLRFWGNSRWAHAAAHSSELLRCFAADEPVSTQEKLEELYARSRISVNLPHIQNQGGLPQRVFDILRSPSLLVTEASPTSDLARVFGGAWPAPLYKDDADLRRICQHFLANERERADLARACNQLLARSRSTYDDWASRVIEAALPGRTPERASAPAHGLVNVPAYFRWPAPGNFRAWAVYWFKKWLRRALARVSFRFRDLPDGLT